MITVSSRPREWFQQFKESAARHGFTAVVLGEGSHYHRNMQRVRMILEENKTERQSINRRVREANVALDQALDAETPDENVIEQRINDFAAAQTAQTRMRIHTEMKIRRELTPEQLSTLRRLRLQVRDFVNGQRPLNPQRRNIRRQP